MSHVYNPETDIIAQIERLQLAYKDTIKHKEDASLKEGIEFFEKHAKEIEKRIAVLRRELPPHRDRKRQ